VTSDDDHRGLTDWLVGLFSAVWSTPDRRHLEWSRDTAEMCDVIENAVVQQQQHS